MTHWCELLSVIVCAGGLSLPAHVHALPLVPAPDDPAQRAEPAYAALLAPLPIAPLDGVRIARSEFGHAARPQGLPGPGAHERFAQPPSAVPVEIGALHAASAEGATGRLAQGLALLAAVALVARRRMAWFRARHASPPTSARTGARTTFPPASPAQAPEAGAARPPAGTGPGQAR